jgi:pyruvate dehydrogenase E2 component (dihydrolipoamide acetyltransferase)
MMTDFIMPKLGLTMEEGTVVRWLAAEGDRVSAGDIILEVQTDKVTVEVEAPAQGVLSQLLVVEGQTVPVGTVLARIGESHEAQVAQAAPAPRSKATPLAQRIAADRGIDLTRAAPKGSRDRITAAEVRGLAATSAKVFSSPRARRRAREAGIDWRQVDGSGPRGRVIERDILKAAPPTPATELDHTLVLPVPPPTPKSTPPGGIRWEGPTPVQRAAAERTAATFTSTPHFYLTSEVRAGRLLEMRERLLPAIERRAGVRLTITDLLVKIAAIALQEHPRANAFWQAGSIGVHERIDVGLATATVAGLVVPVVRAADRLPLAELARERSRLVEAGRAGKLALDDVRPGTFTLSNLGGHRVDQFQPVLNAPESVILAVGRIAPRPFVIDGQLAVTDTMLLTIACDHRVLDGDLAAAFFDRLIQLVEEPYELLV